MNLTARIAATLNRSGAARSDVAGAAAMPAVSRGFKGTTTPSRTRALLATLSLAILAAALIVTPAFAAPSLTTPVVSDVSYTSAHVASEADPQAPGFVSYAFQVSTNGTDWTNNATGGFSAKGTISGDLTGLDDGTQYFVRLAATKGFGGVGDPPEATSPAPNPSFTTLTADPPTILGAVAATGVFSTSASATGEVNRPAASDNVNCHFEYISDDDFNANSPGEGFTGATSRDCAQNPLEAAGSKAVSAPLGCTSPVVEAGSCLIPSTTYHLRLVAENAGGTVTKDAASTFTTLATVAKPTVLAIDSPAEITKRTAKVTGKIERPAGADPALDVSCRFEFITDAQFLIDGFTSAGQAPCVENPITSPAPDHLAVSADVTAELSGLEPGATYHLRLVAENGGGSDSQEAAGTFTTLPVIPPTLTVDSITEVGYTSFRVTATADPGNQGVYPTFEFSPAGAEQWEGNPVGRFNPTSAGSPARQISFTFPCGAADTGPHECDSQPLKPGTTYEVRLTGQELEENSQLHSPEPYPEFTTKGTSTPAIASLDPVTDFTATTAHFSGMVDPNAPPGPLTAEGKAAYKTDWHIECIPECKDANGNEIGGTIEGDAGPQPFAVDAKRLEPNKDYEAKLIASNVLGAVESVQVFHTEAIVPSVIQTSGAPDGEGGYTLQGVVNPNNETITDCEFKWGPDAPNYAFAADCSPLLPNPGAKPTTVEAHLTGLNSGVNYHALLIVTYGVGDEAKGVDQTFKATFATKQPCPKNEQERTENNSLTLPECRAYEMVTPSGKEGFDAGLETYFSGAQVGYYSGAGNIAKSGQNALPSAGGGKGNQYVATRTASGWQTIPDLNGSSGSLYDAPSNVDSGNLVYPLAYSQDLLTSVWSLHRQGEPGSIRATLAHRRGADGTFALVGNVGTGSGEFTLGDTAYSADLSHILNWSKGGEPSYWGPGVYEFLGTGSDEPRRVDIDNSKTPISSCMATVANGGNFVPSNTNAIGLAISGDGDTALFKTYGALTAVPGTCQPGDPPADELWARVNGTTTIDVSASQCDRPAPLCNDPANASFAAATPDGSRVFFNTTQQLVDGDTDETNDIYACDIPSGNPPPTADKANHCAAFRQISGADIGAEVEIVKDGVGRRFLAGAAFSDNGTTAMFIAKGVLADNEDALGNSAVAGDHNLYVWRTDASHPDGQTAFVGRLENVDVDSAQATPDGRYLVFTTTSQLLETDTDDARDVYRYDADTRDLTRASTNVLGVAGNGSTLDAAILGERKPKSTLGEPGGLIHPAISDDGQKVVFTTSEALSPADGNAEPDVYLWTPTRVSLISTGTSGFAPKDRQTGEALVPRAAIAPTGDDIYFESAQQLTPADPDGSNDIYDARVGGGFSFAQAEPCNGEKCQPDPTPPSPNPSSPANIPNGEGNVKPPKPCPKGKVRKRNGKCVKKHAKGGKHKKQGKKHKRAGSNGGGGK